jgi:hypothetical protein
VDVASGSTDLVLRATHTRVKSPGFLAAYADVESEREGAERGARGVADADGGDAGEGAPADLRSLQVSLLDCRRSIYRQATHAGLRGRLQLAGTGWHSSRGSGSLVFFVCMQTCSSVLRWSCMTSTAPFWPVGGAGGCGREGICHRATAALHQAATAVHGGQPGPHAGGARHRAAVNLCGHHQAAAGARGALVATANPKRGVSVRLGAALRGRSCERRGPVGSFALQVRARGSALVAYSRRAEAWVSWD